MNKKASSNSKKLGLIGRNISYSFSPHYFEKKFKALGLNHLSYDIFDLKKIEEVREVFAIPHLLGLNVTIPYKQEVIPYLDNISPEAESIGAVNTIQIVNRKFIGHNTDYIGFSKSIQPLIQKHHQKAMILGTGGANKAVQFALNQLHIPFTVISRSAEKGDFTYDDLTTAMIQEHTIIINTTPLGTYPNIQKFPKIPIQAINSSHLVYDLIYNPTETTLLNMAKNQGASIKNGLEMLELQADAAWEIWNKNL